MEIPRSSTWLSMILVCRLLWCASADSDVDALLAIKDALGGSPKTLATWTSTTNPCNASVPWVGIQCSKAGRVTSLNLANQTLDGTLSASIAALTELSTLNLYYNRLGGQVPNVFGNMSSLKTLDLSMNQFAGPLPNTVGATNITTLLLFNNNFNGSIPATFGKMQKLQVANLSSNNLHGSLPPAFLALPALQILDLSNNYLSGAIPDTDLSSTLQYVNVEDNTFNGTVPANLAKGVISFLYKGNPGLVLPTNLAPAPAPVLKTPAATKAAPSPTAVDEPASAPTAVDEPVSAPTVINEPASAPTAVIATSSPTPALTLPPQGPSNASTASGTISSGSAASSAAAGTANVAPQGTSKKDSGSSNTGLVVGASVGCAVAVGLIIAGVVALLMVRKKKRTPPEAPFLPTTTKDTWQGYPDAPVPPRPATGRGFGGTQVLPLPLIERGTHGFAESQQVGTGVGSKVYVAALPDGDPGVVSLVKRKDPAIAGFQSKSEYENEVAELAKLQHKNLVPLAGCCDDDRERILIFSAPSTTSLRAVLRLATVNDPLDWVARVEIASGIAAALAYLHSKAGPHRLYDELATSSVILDSNLRPRLADFQIQDTEASADSPNSKRPTFERRSSGDWSATDQKRVPADVYNFGVTLLELITGRPSYCASSPVDERNLVSWALPLLAAQDFGSLLDERLGDCTEASLSTLSDLAHDCLSEHETSRPSLAEVQKRIERCLHLHRSGTPYRSPYVKQFASEWDEESEYEVRDVPDGPSPPNKSFPFSHPETIQGSSPTDSGSAGSYHSLG